MTIIIISLVLLASLLPHLTFTAHVGIVNGREVKPHSRPYMVSIQMDEEHICGGFLISTQFVLTAAHCWFQGQVLTVVVGAHELNNSCNLYRFEVKSYIVHPNYKRSPIRNDIMLLKLEKKVKLNNNIGLISLPMDGKNVEAGAHCSVAGWGDLETNGSLSDRLMEANVITISETQCQYEWGSFYVASQMICAHGCGGSCHGDSGGPLVCEGKAYGVTSFGDPHQCNSPEHPNVYTKISAYLPWIRTAMKRFHRE